MYRLPLLIAFLLLLVPQGVAATDNFSPVLPDLRGSVAERTEGQLSIYDLDVTFDPATSTIGGLARISWINMTGVPLDLIAFRLFPNAWYYDEGGTQINGVLVDGLRWMPRFDETLTTMYIDLGSPVVPGGTLAFTIDFVTTVPTASTGSYGILNHDLVNDSWILADWYPILAGWDPMLGWRVDFPTSAGDPTFSDAAFYSAEIRAPAELTVIGTGDETPGPAGDGERVWQINAGPAREFTLVADATLASRSAMAGATRVTVWGDEATVAGPGLEATLSSASRALSVYSRSYGSYPFAELDLVAMNLVGALGVSWTGLIFVDEAALLPFEGGVADPARLDFTIGHEVGHQWWGAVVGINSNDHAFLVEGLTNYLTVLYVEATAGDEAAARQLQMQVVNPYLNALAAHGDGVADVPVGSATSGPPPGSLLYGKAALGFMAIHQTIGDDAFQQALADWAAQSAFRTTQPDDLRIAFEAASGVDLNALWARWFNSAVTTPADVEALLAA